MTSVITFLSYYDGVISVAILIFLIIWATKITSKVKDLEPLRKNVSRLIDGLDKIDKIDNKLDRLGNRFDSRLDRLGNKFDSRLDKMYDLLLGRYGKKDSLRTDSPLSLSDYGKTLSEKMDAPSLIRKYKERLKEETADMNAYEMQSYCFDFADSELLDDLKKRDKDRFDQINNLAYQEGVKITKLTRVLGIELRDGVLELVGKTQPGVGEPSPSED